MHSYRCDFMLRLFYLHWELLATRSLFWSIITVSSNMHIESSTHYALLDNYMPINWPGTSLAMFSCSGGEKKSSPLKRFFPTLEMLRNLEWRKPRLCCSELSKAMLLPCFSGSRRMEWQSHGSSMPSQDFRLTCSCKLTCIVDLTGAMTWKWVSQASIMYTALEETVPWNFSLVISWHYQSLVTNQMDCVQV